MRRGRHSASADEQANIQARREAREKGFEYRPTTKANVDEAERLNRGFAMMEEAHGQDSIDHDEE